MSMKNFKIDKYIIMFVAVIVLMAFIVVITFKTVFSSLETAYSVDTKLPSSETSINKEKLNSAYKEFFEREIIPLQTN